jgi:hypothetical protein
MNVAIIDPTLAEGSAILCILSAVVSANLWIMRQYFIQRATFETLRAGDREQYKLDAHEMSREIESAKSIALASNQRHDLAKAPFESLTEMLREVKLSIENSNERAAARDAAFQAREEKIIVALTGVDKRVAVIEAIQVAKRKR